MKVFRVLPAPTIVSCCCARQNIHTCSAAHATVSAISCIATPLTSPFKAKRYQVETRITMPSLGAIDQEIASRLSEELGALEQLRALLQGNEEVSIPGVVVAGAQSAGKSSVLEALGGMKLPRGQNITTRAASSQPSGHTGSGTSRHHQRRR